MPLKDARRTPRATYRVQLHAGFGFAELVDLLPYLRALGISDVYSSPIFTAAPGSTHGYDVSDYRRINPELGGEDGFRALVEALRANELGLILDFVPNHMGISGTFNIWWRDVLELGPQSRYAQFFDIHWNHQGGNDRVLAPVLEKHYGVVLEEGGLSLQQKDGGLYVKTGETLFPLRPKTCAEILRRGAQRLSPRDTQTALTIIADDFERIEHEDNSSENSRAVRERFDRLITTNERIREALEAVLREINGQPGEPASFDELDRLLDQQHYRLARWKTGAHEVNYRRFFAIDTLIGLRMERDEVFSESHQRLAELVREGCVTGLRIDHIDGLWDPERYLGQLAEITRAEGQPPVFTLVEKIVERDEHLPGGWLAHGTTGYEFAADVAQLLTDARCADRFDRIYGSFTGQPLAVHDLIYDCKRLVLDEMFSNAVNNLAHQLDDLLGYDRRLRDLTFHELATAIREVVAQFDMYRTYRRPGVAATAEDIAAVDRAVEAAKRKNPRLDPEPFDALRNLLTGHYPREEHDNDFKSRALGWVMTFQQYTGAIMAKAVEDTAFYRHNRLIALNEVGGDPGCFGYSVERFHAACRWRAEHAPLTMLTTSTHDTKLSEDARSRLLVLSEMPEEWESWLAHWRELNAPHKTHIDGRAAPDENEEYRLYQTLLAAWPADRELDATLMDRVKENFRKATAEAKRNTTWINPNDQWLEAGDRFIEALFDPAKSDAFLQSFRAVAGRIARLGVINSVVHAVLKITTPGVPDFYQGNTLLDFSLVDPDNRRPVDFSLRKQSLAQLAECSWRELLRNWGDGRLKQRAIRDLLQFRAQHADLFSRGSYVPLEVTGRFAEHVVAFARRVVDEEMVVVVPRLTAKLGCPPLGLIWDDTQVMLEIGGAPWTSVLTGAAFENEATVRIAELFHEVPVAILHRDIPH